MKNKKNDPASQAKEIHEEDRVLNEDQRKQAVDMFTRFLSQERYRSTAERYKVLDAVLNMGGHFNADELYAAMVLKKLRISRATVYSTLELLEKAGLIVKHNFRSDRSYYEIGFDEPHHDHLICIKCGRITEFVYPQLTSIRKQIAERAGLKVVDHSFQIFGDCTEPEKCPHNN